MKQRPEPAGFGNCGACPYRETGTVAICHDCARETVPRIRGRRCGVCDLALIDGECRNPICKWDDRHFDRNHAVAFRTGALEQAINRYKYEDKHGWALIFARVLLGYLEEHRDVFEEFDLIVASPTFVHATEGRPWHHTQRVLQKAAQHTDHPWPFDLEDPPAIIKTAATPSFAGLTWKARNAIASGALRDALSVPNPERTGGKRILVYDDIFTDGHTLNEVARALVEQGGALSVSGVTLARQPWKARGS